MKKVLMTAFIIIFSYPVYVMSSIYLYSFKSSDQNADAAIVLGAAVWDGYPSPVFEERIKHSVKLYHSNRVRQLIFTGSIGEGDTQSEALVAMEYAVNHGVTKSAILLESQSKFTFENLQFAAELMTANPIKTVLLVSDPLHMKRSMMMAKELGIQALPSPTQTSRYKSAHSKIKMLLSESYHYIGYQLRTWLQ